jgi:hypothetical protein
LVESEMTSVLPMPSAANRLHGARPAGALTATERIARRGDHRVCATPLDRKSI